MNDVKRYTFEYYADAPHDSGMEEDVDGKYVRFDDYAALRKKLEEAEKRILLMSEPCRCDPVGSGEEYCNGGCALRSELSRLKRESVSFVALRKLAQAWMKYFEWQNEQELAGKTWWGYPKPNPKRMTHSAGAKELAEEIASLCGMRLYRAARLARKDPNG